MKFLISHQNPDGTFGKTGKDIYGRRPGVVGMGVLAMMAHGSDWDKGSCAKSIRAGLNFILKNQNPQTGYIGSSMYSHGFATLALINAAGRVDDARLDGAVQSAVSLILSAQKNNSRGAWRYSPQSRDADVCVTGINLWALIAAQRTGHKVPTVAINKGLTFVISCQSIDGGFGYTRANGSNMSRTTIGVTMLALAGRKGVNHREGMRYIRTQLKKNNDGKPIESHYGFYEKFYTSQAMFLLGFKDWRDWDQENLKYLEQSQNKAGGWSGRLGASMATSLALLTLRPSFQITGRFERDMRRILPKPKGQLTAKDHKLYYKQFSETLRKLAKSADQTAQYFSDNRAKLNDQAPNELPKEVLKKLNAMADEVLGHTKTMSGFYSRLDHLLRAGKNPMWGSVLYADDNAVTKLRELSSSIRANNGQGVIAESKELSEQLNNWAEFMEKLKYPESSDSSIKDPSPKN